MLEELWLWFVNFGAPTLVLVLPIVGLIFRDTIAKFVASHVQHAFDQKLEKVKSELRSTEEEFKSKIRHNEQKVKMATDLVLSLSSARQSAIETRKLTALERIWCAKVELDKLKLTATLLQSVNIEGAMTATDQKTTAFFKLMDEKIARTNDTLPKASIEPERPYVPTNVWLAFSAYQSVLYLAVVVLKHLATGVGEPKLINFNHTEKILREALPGYSEFIDKYGSGGFFFLIEPLEQNLFKSVVEALDGKLTDEAAMARAATLASSLDDLAAAELIGAIPQNLKAKEVPIRTPEQSSKP